MHVIEWTAPPSDWTDSARELVIELQSRPGEWALIHQNKNIHPSYLEFLEDCSVEWRSVPGRVNGTSNYYARSRVEKEMP